MASRDKLTIKHISNDFSIEYFNDPAWKCASLVEITTYWSGEEAPVGRQFDVRLLWSDAALYVQFCASQSEPVVVSEEANVTKKTIGLWERDVCEIFIAPDASLRNRYFEFEIAPTGEWLDLGIEISASQERKTDWDYKSGMTSATKIEKDKVKMAIRIPFASLGKAPRVGDVWLGNLFRCVGMGPTRGYLAWQPTETEKPSFHVPEKFGEFRFVD